MIVRNAYYHTQLSNNFGALFIYFCFKFSILDVNTIVTIKVLSVVAGLVANVSLLIGVYKNLRNYLLVWLVCSLIGIIVSMIAAIIITISWIQMRPDESTPEIQAGLSGVIITMGISVLLQSYFWLVIWSLFQQYKEREQQPQSGIQNDYRVV